MARQFEDLISTNGVKESSYQKFLEDHPEFLVEPFLLNHQLHFGAVISQFRLDTTLTADFCYLTKSTGNWWLVLIEIERPDIPLFRNNKLQLTPTAEFSERFAQIQAWRDAAADRPQEIIRQVSAIRKPLEDGPVEFKYVLVIGRDPTKQSKAIRDRFNQMNGTDLRILTFDTLLRNYKEGRGRACNVLTLNKGKIRFKNLHLKPKNMLAYVPSTDLLLSAQDKHRLRRWGISVNAWERGEPESFEMRIKKHFKRLK